MQLKQAALIRSGFLRHLGSGNRNLITKEVEAQNVSLEESGHLHFKSYVKKIDTEMKALIKGLKKDMQRQSLSKDF